MNIHSGMKFINVGDVVLEKQFIDTAKNISYKKSQKMEDFHMKKFFHQQFELIKERPVNALFSFAPVVGILLALFFLFFPL